MVGIGDRGLRDGEEGMGMGWEWGIGDGIRLGGIGYIEVGWKGGNTKFLRC